MYSRQGDLVTLANKITLFRIAMIPVFSALIFSYTQEKEWLRYAALAVYTAAAISDGVDGWVARNYNQRTRLGARLDPLADKLIINLGLVFAAANPQFTPDVPLWFPVLVLARDVVIVLGAYVINEYYGGVTVRPLWSGKLTTTFQLATLIGILIPVPFALYIMWVTVGLTVFSGVHYVLIGYQQAGQRKAI